MTRQIHLQIHESVPEAMRRYLRAPNANLGGDNLGGVNAVAQARDARKAVAALLNCRPEEVVFGGNMTSLAFHISHSLADSELIKRPGSARRNLVVTRMDHDANVTPWLRMAERTGTTVRWAPLAQDKCSLDLVKFGTLLDDDTVFVAIGYASNACGTINPVKDMIRYMMS
jgi:selenocysteine lyase/cysteine desulfurase